MQIDARDPSETKKGVRGRIIKLPADGFACSDRENPGGEHARISLVRTAKLQQEVAPYERACHVLGILWPCFPSP
jgi:hypothetical protein